jgi:nicotinate-nucleotide--dimethylbenzimidazole phosphoribosyltransferase
MVYKDDEPSVLMSNRVKEIWANKVKPEFSLGFLEEIVVKIATITGDEDARLHNPTLLLLASDHHITQEGVSNSAPEITYQQLLNFSSGGGAVSLMAKDHGIKVHIVDCGVDYDFKETSSIINMKVDYGAKNFLTYKAMTLEQMHSAMKNGVKLIQQLLHSGCNVVLFGEMGIGNTTSSSAITASILALDPTRCTSRGAGLYDWQLEHKIDVIRKAIEFHKFPHAPLEVLSTFGGYEIATMVGAILESARNNMLIIIDGFVTSSALLIASHIDPSVTSCVLASHKGKEKGHQIILDHLKLRIIRSLDLSLGEGSGAILCWPIIKMAIHLYQLTK